MHQTVHFHGKDLISGAAGGIRSENDLGLSIWLWIKLRSLAIVVMIQKESRRVTVIAVSQKIPFLALTALKLRRTS